jgi:hypothetical protein
MDLTLTRWRQRPAAPGPLWPALAVLAMAMLPAVAGAAFDWSVWLILGLLLPAMLGTVVLGRMGGRARGWPAPPLSSRPYRAALPAVCALFFVVAVTVPDRYIGLVLVALGVIIDQAEREKWRRAEARQ